MPTLSSALPQLRAAPMRDRSPTSITTPSTPPRRPRLPLVSVALLLIALATPFTTTPSHAQITVYVDTPLASGSVSGDVQSRAGVAPDATVHAGGGVALSGAAALRNPLLSALGIAAGTEEAGRPQATTAAHVAAPGSIAQTLRPTVGFSFGEARGAAGSGTAGGYLVGEIAYNPVANQLGASVSGGSAGTANARSGDSLGGVLAAGDAAGLSGAESLGWVDAQTTAGGGRAGQEAQAIAYPTNALSPLNPATCTQALTYGAARSNYGLDGVAMPLIRGNEDNDGDGAVDGEGGGGVVDGYGSAGGGAWGVPMCLALFDWGTLDDFVAFVERPPGLADGVGEGGEDGAQGEHLRTGSKFRPASFEDYVDEAASEEALQQSSGGGGGGDSDHEKKQKRQERAALRAIAAGDGGGAIDPPSSSSSFSSSSPPSSVLYFLATAFREGGQGAVETFLRDTSLGREMMRRAAEAEAARQRSYEDGSRAPPLRETLARAAEALAPSAADARRAATELRNVAARNATNLLVQGMVAVAESAEPALALQQRARAALLDPLQRTVGRAAGGLLTGAAERLERQGGGGGGGGGQRQGAFADAAAALRASAALAVRDVASAAAGGAAGQQRRTAGATPKRRRRRRRVV